MVPVLWFRWRPVAPLTLSTNGRRRIDTIDEEIPEISGIPEIEGR
jgi:hypothetical protein